MAAGGRSESSTGVTELTLRAGWRKRRYVLEPGRHVVGRGAEADIVFDDTGVSRLHAELVVSYDGTVEVHDLGSTNGTYLNGEPVSGPQPLHDGDAIRIGDSEFTFER